MKLNMLITYAKSGQFRIGPDPNLERAVVGNMPLNDAQCRIIANNLGWTGRTSYCGWQMIDKAIKFANNVKRNIGDNEVFCNNADVMFESIRKTDSDKCIERTVLDFGDFTYTIIHGMDGIGGAYGLFDSRVSRATPVKSSSSYNKIFEYINEHF